MKQGIHIPPGRRDDMARLAVAFTSKRTEAEAKKTVQRLFDVSEPVALNLLERGRFLAREALVKEAIEQEKAE